MRNPVKILLIEDEPLWQKAIQDLIAGDSRFEVVAVSDDFVSALAAYEETRPEAVLLDWQIHGLQDGLAVGDAILQKGLPPERIILISGANPSSIPSHPFLYVPKNRIADELLGLLASVTLN